MAKTYVVYYYNSGSAFGSKQVKATKVEVDARDTDEAREIVESTYSSPFQAIGIVQIDLKSLC